MKVLCLERSCAISNSKVDELRSERPDTKCLAHVGLPPNGGHDEETEFDRLVRMFCFGDIYGWNQFRTVSATRRGGNRDREHTASP